MIPVTRSKHTAGEYDAFCEGYDEGEKMTTRLFDAEIVRYKKALKFYANEKLYIESSMKVTKVNTKTKTVTFGDCFEYGTKILLDRGEVARKALEEIK